MFYILSLNQYLLQKNEKTKNLNNLFEKAKKLCGYLNNYAPIVVNFMEKKIRQYIILIMSKDFLENIVHLMLNKIMVV